MTEEPKNQSNTATLGADQSQNMENAKLQEHEKENTDKPVPLNKDKPDQDDLDLE